MKRTFLIIVISLLHLSYHTVLASRYYLSAHGNDTNSGITIHSPWRTTGKLAQQMKALKPGDSILFERGSTFHGILEIVTTGIYVGSYGSGPKPVISGSVAITQWKQYKGNLWAARCNECPSKPGNFFIDGLAQAPGRYPNTKFLTIAGLTQSQTTLHDSTLVFADGHWNTAEVVVRSSRWTFDKLTVNHYKNKRFTFATPASYSLVNGFGYFIQNHIATLDQHGEWFFDSSSKTLYVYLNPGTKPDQHLMEAGIRDIGLTVTGVRNVTLENLIFTNNKVAGVRIQKSTDIHLTGIDISNSGNNGMEIHSSNQVHVRHSSIYDSNNNGVQWHNTNNSLFTDNQICRTGLHPGRGESGNGTYIALYITGDSPQPGNNLFQNNTIDSVGYSAIDFRTGNTTIKNNLISNFCLVKDDGAGIYTWSNILKGNTIEGNIISSGIGSGAGSLSPMQRFAHGIYIDDRSSDVTIKDNTIRHCSGSGVFLHNAKKISVLRNRVFGNGRTVSNQEKGELYIRIDTLGQFGKHLDMQLKIDGNTWMADETSHTLYISVEKEMDLRQLGVFSNNTFMAVTDQQAIAVMVRQNGSCVADQLSLLEWQRATQYEKTSTFTSTQTLANYATVGNDMIANGTMTKDIQGWISWPEKITISHEILSILDGPSLGIHLTAGNTEALLYHEGISLSKGKLYRLTFTAISTADSHIEFVPLMATKPWQALGAYTCFAIGPARKTFTYYFVAEESNARARVNFKSYAPFWIDTVSLYEMGMNQ